MDIYFALVSQLICRPGKASTMVAVGCGTEGDIPNRVMAFPAYKILKAKLFILFVQEPL